MQRNKTLLLWFLGVIIILAILTVIILRFPGYIFFFDSSGSFSFRRPFDQYLFTYTPYDGVEVGIKNRLPIISIISGIYYFLRIFFPLSPQDVIKIAFVLLFLGAYTAYFYVFPKIYKIFTKKHDTEEITPFLQVIVPLMYLLIPFFVFRQSMVHMFYLTTFYPLIVYEYLKLLELKKFSYKQIYILVITCFFGFAYTNIIHFYIATFAVLGIGYAIKHINEKTLKEFTRNLTVAGLLVILCSLYWIVPYFLKGSPTPGYVVTDMMIKILGDKSSFMNVLFDTSEWFYDSTKGISVFLQDNQLVYALQVAGAVNIYVFAIIAAIKSKNRYITTSVVALIVATFLIITKESPIYTALYSGFVYFDFGWLIREPNRLRFFIAFWLFALFSIGMTFSFIKPKGVAHTNDTQTTDLRIFAYVGLVLFGFYTLPWAVKSLILLKPTVLSTELQSADAKLAEDNSFSYVFHAPAFEWYRTPWVNTMFPLVDNLHYQKIIPYGLSRPSSNLSTVIPTVRMKESYLMEMLFYTASEKKQTDVMRSYGIKNILFDNKAIPIFLSVQDNAEYYVESMHDLWQTGNYFNQQYKGNEYELLQVKDFKQSDAFFFQREQIITAEPLSVLTQLGSDSLRNNTITLKNYDIDSIQAADRLLVNEVNKYPYFDYVTKDQRRKHISYPYDYLRQYGALVDWGKMSPMDKGSAEMSAIFRYHGIRVFQYMEDDKVAYSDEAVSKMNVISQMTYTIDNECMKDCAVFAKVLYSSKGGYLTVSVDNRSKTISTVTDENEGFYWTPIVRSAEFSEKEKGITIRNTAGFGALGGIMIIPEQEVKKLQQDFSQKIVVTIPSDAQEFSLSTVDPNCSVTDTTYNDKGLIPNVTVKGYCADEVKMKLKAFQSEFLYHNKLTNKMEFMDSVAVRGTFDGEIYFFSHVDLILWLMFVVTYAGVISMSVAILLKVVR
jgi:hypothetical protein